MASRARVFLFAGIAGPPGKRKNDSSGHRGSRAHPVLEMLKRLRELYGRVRSPHQLPANLRRLIQQLAIPAEMFARDPHSTLLAVKGVQGVKMGQDDITQVGALKWRRRISLIHVGVQMGVDNAEDPWRTMTRAADHYSVGTREIKHLARFLRRGDVAAPQKAREVLDFTGADGVMIGRASHGAPWIFRVVNAHLNSHVNERNAPPPLQRADLRDIILAHLDSLYSFYGEESGVRIARKHLGWYCELLDEPAQIRGELMGLRTRPYSSRRRLSISSTGWARLPRWPDESFFPFSRGTRNAGKEKDANSRSHRRQGERTGAAAAQSCRARPERVLHQPERPPAGSALRPGAARGRRAAVSRRARLRPGQPEPRRRDPRHQSRHAAKETEAVRTSRLLTAECPRRYAAHSSRFPTRPASSSWRASSPGATSRSSRRAAPRSCWPPMAWRCARSRATPAFPRSWAGVSRRCIRRFTAGSSGGAARTTVSWRSRGSRPSICWW